MLFRSVADGPYPAAAVCAEILDDDPRFALDALGPVHEPAERTRGPVIAAPTPVDEAKREERRQRKQAAKEQRRKQQGPPPARPKRTRAAAPAPVPDTDDAVPASAPTATVNGRVASDRDDEPRRLVRVTGSYEGVDYSDPLIGAVVTATIRWQNEDGEGEKHRPGVVIATCAGDRVVIRPCYSEGGMRSRDWRSVPVTDSLAAGLDRDSYVGPDEHAVDRIDVGPPIGRLSRLDWNAL